MTDPGECRIVAMQEEDVAEVAALESRTFRSPWSVEAFRHELHDNPFARNLVARLPDAVTRVASSPTIQD